MCILLFTQQQLSHKVRPSVIMDYNNDYPILRSLISPDLDCYTEERWKSKDNSHFNFESEIVTKSETHMWSLKKFLYGLEGRNDSLNCKYAFSEKSSGVYWGSIQIDISNDELLIGIDQIVFHTTHHYYKVALTVSVIDSKNTVLLKNVQSYSADETGHSSGYRRKEHAFGGQYYFDKRFFSRILTIDKNLFSKIKSDLFLDNSESYYFLLNIAYSDYKKWQSPTVFDPLVTEKKEKSFDQDITFDLQKSLESKKLCDVKLKFKDDEELFAHKAILMASSDVFSAMFKSNPMPQTGIIVIKIKDIDYEVFNAVLKFMYSRKFDGVKEQLIPGVLQVSEKYKIEALRKFCHEKIQRILCRDNALKILIGINCVNCKSLMQEIIDFILSNLAYMKTTKEFKELKTSHPDLVKKIKGRLFD